MSKRFQKPGWRPFTVRIPEELLAALRGHCRDTGLKIEHWVTSAIQEKLAKRHEHFKP